MDIIDQIIKDRGSLNDLYYILTANSIVLKDLAKSVNSMTVIYPTYTTTVLAVATVEAEPIFVPYQVVAYQSVLDVCVQNYGSLELLPTLLADNNLALNDYLTPNDKLLIRSEFNRNKTSNTLFALQAKVTNYDRDLVADTDIYLGTEDGDYIGATPQVKIKVN
jgi:hypothetical protein